MDDMPGEIWTSERNESEMDPSTHKQPITKAPAKAGHLFSNRALLAIIWPVILEQLLASLMGMVDTMMVSNVGSAAISAVSLVDSINILFIQAFSALAAGGGILIAHCVGQRNTDGAESYARHLIFLMAVISAAFLFPGLLFRRSILSLIFGQVERDVMAGANTYFFITLLSYPFIALYNAASAVFRAQEDTKTPMVISVASNFLNIGGNAFLIWVCGLGIAGAALATLLSRVFCCVLALYRLRDPRNRIRLRGVFHFNPERGKIRRILGIGIPSGVENSMFQLGKLAIQSSVSTLGTIAIAAQAMANIMETLNGVAAVGVGIALMTIIGECIGAGRPEEAVYYIKKCCGIAFFALLGGCLLTFCICRPVTFLAGMEPESAALCIRMVTWISLVKPFLWVFSFILPYGMRSAGDVSFSMATSVATMWIFRFCLTTLLIRHFSWGPMAVWVGMFTDWGVRSVVFFLRFRSRKWLKHQLV